MPETPLQPPSQALATASTAGYLPGDASVTPSGVFTYSMPLDVPAGRAGMAPQLTMSYSSVGRNGPLGRGWSISGMGSSITRCGKTPEVEGTRSGVHYDEEDRFCLDGEKLIGGGVANNLDPADTGEYGGNYTRYRALNTNFTDIVSLNPSRNLDAGPDSFAVATKDGHRRTYVAQTAVQVEESTSLVKTKSVSGPTNAVLSTASPVQHSLNASNRRALWLLDSDEDRSGNKIKYTYDKTVGGSGNEFLLTRIDYTYGPGKAAERHVDFEYQERPDKSFNYVAGIRYVHTKRLVRIKMYAPNPVLAGLVYRYELSYLPTGPNTFDRKHSLLSSVQQCGSAGGCLPIRKFNWATLALPDFDSTTSLGSLAIDTNVSHEPPSAHVLDMDGDGTDDVIYNPGGDDSGETARLGLRDASGAVSALANAQPLNGVGDWPAINGGSTGSIPNIQLKMSRPVDVRSDGRVEFSLRNSEFDGNEFFSRDTILRWDTANNRFVSTGSTFGTSLMGETDFADFDGNGLLDYVASELDDDSWEFRKQNNAGDFGPPVNLNGGYGQSGAPGNCGGARAFDVDGDGRGNLVFDEGRPDTMYGACGQNQLVRADVADDDSDWVWRNQVPGTGSSTPDIDGYYQQEATNLPPLRHQSYLAQACIGSCQPDDVWSYENGLWRWISTLGDFNGDGLLDSILLPRYASSLFATIYRGLILWNTGKGMYWDGTRIDLPHDDLGDLRVGDMNDDGVDDIVAFYHTGLTVDTNDNTIIDDDELVYSGGAQRISVLLSNGDGTFVDDAFSNVTSGTPRVDVGRPLSQLGDFNGDGRLDLMVAGNDELKLMLQDEPAYGSSIQDRIVSIEDEGAATARYGVVYSNQWTDHPENMGSSCAFPLVCPRRGMPVVRQLISYEQTFAAGDAPVSTFYSYHDPVAHITQGMLGFGTTRSWVPARPMEIVTEWDVRTSAGTGGKFYPFANRPKTVTTTVPVLSLAETSSHPASVTNARVVRADYASVFRYLTNTSGPSEVEGDFAVFPRRVHTAEWTSAATIDWSTSLYGSAKPREHITEYQPVEPASPGRIVDELFTFDDYGNLTKHHSVTNGGVTEDVSTQFDLDTQAVFDWLISMPTHHEVTRTEPTIVNNGFETNLRGWSATPELVSVDAAYARSGVSGVKLSPPRPGYPDDPLDSLATQRFTVPSDSGTLSFWYKPSCANTGDFAKVTLHDETTNTSTDALPATCATSGWTKVDAAVTPGHTYTLTLRNHASLVGQSTATLFDDVLLSGPSTQVTRTVDNEYDNLGRLTKTELEKGGGDANERTSYALDLFGLPTTITTSAPDVADRVTHLEYSPVFSTTVNNEVVYQPDERIHASQVWASHDLIIDGRHDAVAYRPSAWLAVHPAFGIPVATEDINGARTTTGWDDLGRPVRITADGAPTTHIGYATSTDVNGKVNGTKITTTVDTGIVDPTKTNVSTTITDQLGRARQTKTTGFDGTAITVDTRYDVLGRPSSRTGPYTATPLKQTIYHYDSLNRPTELFLPSPTGNLYRRSWQYPDFFATIATDERGNQTDIFTDADRRTTRTETWQVVAGTYQPNITTTYGYAPFDLQSTGTDDIGNTTRMSYDVRGRRTKLQDPDRGTVSTSYYGTGDVRVQTHEGTGNSSTYFYDDLGRRVRVVDHDQAENQDRTTTFTWDNANNGIGQLAEAISPDNIRTGYRYDTLGRPAGVDYTTDYTGGGTGTTYSTDTQYDGKGRVSSIGYPNVPARARFTVQNTYNDYGYATDVLDATPGQAAQTLWHTTGRNADLALTGATMAEAGAVTLTNTYDPQTGRLTNLKAEKAGTTLRSISYAYYENGLVYSRNQNDSTVANHNETYHLDELGQLTRWQLAVNGVAKKDVSYGYDTIGNITPAGEERYYGNSGNSACTGTQAGPHALCWVDALEGTGINNYTYDGQGRETIAGHEDGSTRATSYNAFDLPRTIVDGGVTTTFAYDAFGTRLKKSSPAGTTTYVPGLFEKRTAGGRTSYVFYISGPAGPIGQAVYDGTSTTMQYTLTDALGSTGASLSPSGDVTGTFYYEPFGRRTTSDGTPAGAVTSDITHGFTGQEMDDDLGLINLNGRIYDPAKKALLTADPVLTNHPYAYAGNNPTSFTDPTGYDDIFSFPSGGSSGVGPQFGGGSSETVETWTSVAEDGTTFACSGTFSGYSCVQAGEGGTDTDTGNLGSDESGDTTVVEAEGGFEYSPGLVMMANFEAFAEGTGLNSFLEWWNTTMAEAPIGGYDNNNLGMAEADQAIMRPVSNGEFVMESVGALATVLGSAKLVGPLGGMADEAANTGASFNGTFARARGGAYAITKGANPFRGMYNCLEASFAGAKRLLGWDASAIAKRTGVAEIADIPAMARQVFGRAETVALRSMKDVVKTTRARGPGSVGILTEIPGGSPIFKSGHTTVVYNDGGIIRFLDFQGGAAASYMRPSLINEVRAAGAPLTVRYEVTFVTP